MVCRITRPLAETHTPHLYIAQHSTISHRTAPHRTAPHRIQWRGYALTRSLIILHARLHAHVHPTRTYARAQPWTFRYAGDLDVDGLGNVSTCSFICYDREHPESARGCRAAGAELVLVPTACGVDYAAVDLIGIRAVGLSLRLLPMAACPPSCSPPSTLLSSSFCRRSRCGARPFALRVLLLTRSLWRTSFCIARPFADALVVAHGAQGTNAMAIAMANFGAAPGHNISERTRGGAGSYYCGGLDCNGLSMGADHRGNVLFTAPGDPGGCDYPALVPFCLCRSDFCHTDLLASCCSCMSELSDSKQLSPTASLILELLHLPNPKKLTVCVCVCVCVCACGRMNQCCCCCRHVANSGPSPSRRSQRGV
jgi:hypothetical protein